MEGDAHRLECPLRILQCPRYRYGCAWKGLQKELAYQDSSSDKTPTHEAECWFFA